MLNNNGTFMDLCLAGRAFVDEVDDYVDKWYDMDSSLSLPEFLGMSRQEYALWVEKPGSLKYLLRARKNGQPVSDFKAVENQLRMAARADSPEDADEMMEWLRSTGRI